MSLSSKQVAEARGRLHALVCASKWWSEDCRRPDGGRHARETWSAADIRALAADPLKLHDRLCFAAGQHYATNGFVSNCPKADEHSLLFYAHVFGATAGESDTEPDLFAALGAS